MKHTTCFNTAGKLLTVMLLTGIVTGAAAQIKTIQKKAVFNQAAMARFTDSKLAKLKLIKPNTVRTSSISTTPNEVITVSNSPKYATPQKPQFEPVPVNDNCNALPVSYKTSIPEIALIFPPTNLAAKIFPGAVYTFNEIKNLSFSQYTANTARNPMTLSTTIFKAGEQSATEDITTFDYGTLLNKWNAILSRNMQGGSTPGNIQSEVILTESASQLKADLNTFSKVDVGVKLKVPIPDLPVSVSVGEQVSVTNTSSLSTSSEKQKNSIVIRYNQVFYSSMITPKAGFTSVFSGVDESALDNDLLYVSSVDYGQVFYIVITSSLTKDQLLKAVESKVTTKTELGAQVEGLPVEVDVTVGTENNNSSSTQSIITTANTTISVFQQGGNPMPGLGSSLDEVLNNLKNVQTQFSATNLGAPIKFTLNYVKGNALAYINYDLSYATSNCGNRVENKFDVKLELDNFNVDNVSDLDGTEDLYGNIKFINLKANGKSVSADKIFWSRSEDDANENSFRNGRVSIGKEEVLIQNLTLDELLNLELTVGGKLSDDEGPFASRVFKCIDCTNQDGNAGKTFKFSEQATTKNAINVLVANGQYQALKYGNDDIFTVNFYESGIKNDGFVQLRWKVWVKAK